MTKCASHKKREYWKVRLMDLEQTARTGILRTFIKAETNIRKVKNAELI
jgi:hypothetical protein